MPYFNQDWRTERDNEIASQISQDIKDIQGNIISGNSNLPGNVQQAVVRNMLYDYAVAQRRATRNAVAETRRFAQEASNAVDLDKYTSSLQNHLTTQQQKVNEIKAQADAAKAKQAGAMGGSAFNANLRNAPDSEEVSRLDEAAKQAQSAYDKVKQEFDRATAQKDRRDSERTVNDAAERGVSFKDQYDAYSQSLDDLNKQKSQLTEQLSKIRNGSSYYGAASTYEQDKARQEADEKEATDRLEKLEREIERLEGTRAYARQYLTKDAGAKAVIRQGEELARTAKEQGTKVAESNRAIKKITDYISFAPRYGTARNIADIIGKLFPNSGVIQDITGAIGNLPEAYNPLSFIAELGIRAGENTSKTPNDNWSQDQLDLYHFFYGNPDYGKETAEKYAQMVNYAMNTASVNAQTKSDYAVGASKNNGLLKTVGGLAGAVPDMALTAGDAQNKLLDILATGTYAGHDTATAHERFSAFSQGRADTLNSKTLSESIPVIGGKGWGDLYQLGQSALQSISSGHILGEAATLGAFFVNAANSAFDEAMQRTGGNTRYAATFSLLSGAAEVIGEKVSLDHLLKGGKVGSLSFLLKQAGIEGSEEVGTSLLNQFFDSVAAKLTGEQAATQSKIAALVRSGMSYDDAEKQVWKQAVNDLAWDFVGGAVSGFASSGAESVVRRTDNKLWDMRKDSVLGKQNAEGKREGGKNASADQLRDMFQRALNRGDLRGAEQILEELDKLNATEEPQEYGPADPNADERVRRRLERQLNGESLNSETENAEYVEESETNRRLAEEAKIQEQFPTLNPITMRNIERLSVKDLVTAAKTMTTAELAEAERYARFIGENEKADVLHAVWKNPAYRYQQQGNEEKPFPSDEDDPMRYAPKNDAGAQEALGGQITQPSQQNAAQTVKPVNSATTENKLFNVTQNPNGVSTRSTESGTMTVPNTQEVTTNAGEQAVRTDEAAEESERGGRYTGTSRDDDLSRILPVESGNRAGENAEAGSEKISQKSAGEQRTVTAGEDGTEYESTFDGESVQSIVTDGANKEVKNGRTVTNGTRIVKNPARSSKYYPVWALAKSFGESDNIIILDNETGPCIATDGIPESKLNGFHSGNKIVILFNGSDIKNIPARFHQYFNLSKTFIHEYMHKQLKKLYHSTGVKLLDSWDYYNSIKSIASKALDKAGFDAEFVNALADKFLDNGYSNTYDRAGIGQAFLDGYDLGLFGKNIPRENFAREVYRMMASEEIITCFVSQDINAHILADKYGITADKLSAISSAIANELNSQNVYDDNVEAAINNFDSVISSNDSKTITSDDNLGRAVRRAASGDTSYMKNTELLAVLNYALDRAAPTSKGQPLSERLSDLYNEYGNSATSYISEANEYFGRHVGNLSEGKTNNLMRTVDTVLRELDRRGYSFDRVQSTVDNFENKFGLVEDKTLTEFYRGKNGPYGVSKKKNSFLDLSQEAKEEETSREDADHESEAETEATEADYDRRNMKRDVDALRNGTNYVKEAVPTKPEDHGWIKPVEVSEKDVKRAREAVEAKGKEAELKDRIKTLEAQKKYLETVAKGMQEARSGLYNSGDVEQRKADLGYIADSLNEQLEQLDADLGYVAEGIIGTEEEAAMDSILAQKERANAQLNALRDEYKHIGDNDSAALRNVRTQIDSVVSEIAALSRQLDGVSKRAERADWGSNKRTLFQAEMAENPARESKSEMPAPNVYGPYTTPALNRVFRQQVAAELETDQMRITDEDDSAEIKEPTRGMGTGYRGMQRSRNKDGSLEFRTMYDDVPPARPATDKPRKPLNQPSTAYGNVAQAARSILNSKNSFFDFSEKRPKDIPSKVTNAMGQLYSHVREMMEGDHPVNALMQLSNLVHEFANDDDLKMFTSNSIQHAVDELNDIYYNQDITNEEKARRMVENATKTLTLISKRAQLVDRSYTMLKAFKGPRKKRDSTTFWSKFKAMQLNPSTLFKALDGFDRRGGGSGYKIAKMIENGTALYTITQTQALKRLSEISGLEGFKEFAEGNEKPFDIDGVRITEQQAVEFIMQVRNLLNTEVTGKDGPTNRLNTIDGFSIKDKNGKNVFLERSDDADGTNAEWFKNLAEGFENSLSPAAKKYLETATEILDDLGQQASDIRTNLIGTGFEGSINGTYYPITYDNKNGTSYSQQDRPTSLADGPMYQSRTRNVGGYVSIKNASDTLDKYIHWASNFIGYGEVAELLHAMDNTGSRMQNLSGLANETLGQGYSDYIAKFVNDVNENSENPKNEFLAKIRQNMASGALLGNLGVAAKQAASLWSGVGVLSPQALLAAETWFGGHSGAGSMLLQSRATGTSIDPSISEILHNDSFMAKLMKRSGVSEFMGKATALVDYQTVKRLFAATVVDTKLSFPGMDQNSELFARVVEAKFQDVVLQTQPIFVKNARAGYLRSNDELMKAIAMFRTQPTQNLNAIATAIGEYKALKGTDFGKAAGKKLCNTIIGQASSAFTFALLSSVVGFARHSLKKYRDDDDELSWAEVAKRIGLDTAESLAGISVFGGDLAKAIITIATGGEEKEFYDLNAGVLSMVADTASSVTTFGTNLVKAITEGKSLAVFNAGRQAADNIMQVGLGIPANTIYRLLNAATMYTADAIYALSDGKLGNRANYDDAMKMLDSYIKGNLTEEGAKKQADKAFRKDQPENLLYNLGILSSLTSKDSKVDKGTDWLNTRIQGKNEAERKAYKEDELARLGRNLNSGERIANYLADSALSAAKKDEAISRFATTSGYNVLYESLRAAGMTPKAAVEELGKTDNKTGLSTDIRDQENLTDLYAGKDNPGETNDVPALEKKNTDEYINFVSAVKVFKNTSNYSQLDKLVDQYSKLDANTRAVIEAKDSTMKKYREYRSMGFSTKDYYNVKDAIKQAQIDLNLAANTGTVVKLVGLSKTNLTKAQMQKLIESESLGISKTGKSLISVLSKYGYTIGDVGMFMYNTDWTNDDANGTLSQQEVVLALAKEKRLTDAQRSAIYEELKSLLRNEYKINHWYDKSYEYELNYLLQNGKTSGRAS